MSKKKDLVSRTEMVFLFIISILVAGFLGACEKKSPPPKKEAVPVLAAAVIRKTVPVQLRAIGNVEAYATVGVKAQIGGELARVHFREGQDVKKGDLLFTIDPRPYEAALKQAEANLAKDAAQMENARVEARRYEELVKKGFVAQEQYDQKRTTADALEATVNADKALVENARLQLKYCYIYSPIAGRTGYLQSNQGNLIKANADNPMVTINQIQPIYVTFSVPEQNLSELKKYMSIGKIKVQAVIAAEEAHPEEGVLTFVDNAVDVATGTIKLKATFPNSEKKLWPGQFVNVVLTLTTIPDAVVAPSQAIQSGQQGQFVFVVKADYTVESRPVTTGITYNAETVVTGNLKAGDMVVTDGQMMLFPGAKVEIKRYEESSVKGTTSAGGQSPGNAGGAAR